MTSFNRCRSTVACLESLFAQQGIGSDFSLAVFLVDAGSSDGTKDAVNAAFPSVRIAAATPTTYWGGGMRLASQVAQDCPADYDLWLNDDVVLRPTAIRTLLETAAATGAVAGTCLVVGQMVDADGRASYGGFVRASSPLGFEHVGIHDEAVRCDTFNGNLVLVPRAVTVQLGSIDAAFPHGMGDIDFGLRAKREGFANIQAPGVLGTCDTHLPTRPAGGRRARLRDVTSIKRLPPRAWWTFCRRYAGWWAPALFAKPYVDALRSGRTPQ